MAIQPKIFAKLIVCFALLIFVTTQFAFKSKEVTFTFAAEDGMSFIQKVTVTREKYMGSVEKQMDESISVTHITMKKTQDGWDLIARPGEFEMKRNGQLINHPVASLLSKITLTYKLDQEGYLYDIVGYEKVIEAFYQQIPPEMVESLKPLINVEMLKQKESAEYNGRIGDFIAETVSPGDQWEYPAPFTLPNGEEVEFYITTHFKEMEGCGRSDCIRIEQIYDSDSESLADLITDVTQSVAENIEKDVPTIAARNSSIRGKAVRLIDPSTMLIYEEEIERTMVFDMEVPEEGRVQMKVVEKRLYQYEYE